MFDVAHIYPHSLRNQEHAAIFIKTLRTYWNEERVNAWLSAAYGIGVAGPHNLICLSPNAHRLHGAAYFAFDFGSYSQDGEKKSLELRFHWLKRAALRIQIPAAEIPSLELEMPTSVALFDIQKNCGDRDHRFRSGKMVRVETDDPIQKPLPLQPLIEMQWLLNGVAALSAAAEPEVLQGDESSDDDDDWRLRLCSSDFVPGSTPRNSSQDTSLPSSSAGHKVRTGKDEKPDFE